MKQKLILVISFMLVVVIATAQADRMRFFGPDKKNVIKVNLLSPFLGTLSVQHERIINNESSIQLGLYYFSGEVFGRQIPLQGLCFTPEYRFYLSGDAPDGFYVQPYGRIARFWPEPLSHVLSTDVNFTGLAGGIVFGRQWLIKDRFTVDLYAGPLYTKLIFDHNIINTSYLPPPFDGYWFRSGLTMGYCFR